MHIYKHHFTRGLPVDCFIALLTHSYLNERKERKGNETASSEGIETFVNNGLASYYSYFYLKGAIRHFLRKRFGPSSGSSELRTVRYACAVQWQWLCSSWLLERFGYCFWTFDFDFFDSPALRARTVERAKIAREADWPGIARTGHWKCRWGKKENPYPYL